MKSSCVAGLLALCAILQIANCVIKVDTSTQMYVDEAGRVRIFHGVNAVYKVPPWYPQTEGFDPALSLSDIDAKNLQSWGFNAVRLGMMWPGVEPVRGQFNTTYLSVMNGIVKTLAKYGIYTILDAHQDLFNRKFCGEGAPDWAAFSTGFSLSFPLPIATPQSMNIDPTTGYPDIKQCLSRAFAFYYESDAVGNAFQNLYDNTQGIQDEFAAFWSSVSSYFNNSQTVLGYELINEPWAGDIYANPSYLVMPGFSDKQNLAPMYSKLHSKIRENDDQHIIFFEKSLADIEVRSGFSEGPGGVPYNDRQSFSYHIYCAPVDSEGNPTHIFECDFADEFEYDLAMDDVNALGCGGFMTEFGAMSNTSYALDSIDYLTGAADKRLQSWTYWQFKLFNDITTAGPGESFYQNGQLSQSKVKHLSRTYAQAIQGIPTAMSFDPNSAVFQLNFNLNTNIHQLAPTLIYLNEPWYYPNGYVVTVTPANTLTVTTSPNLVSITYNSAAVNGQACSVTIKPK